VRGLRGRASCREAPQGARECDRPARDQAQDVRGRAGSAGVAARGRDGRIVRRPVHQGQRARGHSLEHSLIVGGLLFALAGCGDEGPELFEPGPPEPPRALRAFGWAENSDGFVFRNGDGAWTIYKRCFDQVVRGRRWSAGPGYVVRMTDTRGRRLVNDYRPRRDLWSPGYLNSMNGGLGTFGWHHVRGRAGRAPAGDDPTTARVERRVDRRLPGYSLEGRMCASSNGGTGVYAVSWSGPRRAGDTIVFRFDVWLRDPGRPVARVRYDYVFGHSAVAVNVAIRTLAAADRFVKEPKLVALVRGGAFRRMSVYGRAFQKGVLRGSPESTRVLRTEHSARPDRLRVTWDYGRSATEEGKDPCAQAPCFTVAGAAGAAGASTPWENGRLGLDGWATAAAREPSTWPRDTRGAQVVSTCGVQARRADDRNGDGKLDARERSLVSQRASPDQDAQRRWEHGGWKASPTSAYSASSTAFLGWQGSRGPGDCEPLERTLRPATWRAYLVYSVADGWQASVAGLTEP
jgi:hypothetical protein